MSTFAENIAAAGVLGAFLGPNSTSLSIRDFPLSLAPYPLHLCFDDAQAVGPGLPTLPDVNYPIGAGVNRQASGADGLYMTLDGTTWSYIEPLNYLITNKARDNSVGNGDANIVGFVQNKKFVKPFLTTQFGAPCIAVPVPTKSDGKGGGYFDTPFHGTDQPTVRIGPDNGGEIYIQFKYRTTEMIHNDFGGVANNWQNTLTKNMIFGHAPTSNPDLQFFASEPAMSSVMGWWSGFGSNRDGIHAGYNRGADGGNTLPFNDTYLQDATACLYAGSGPYPFPPCIALADGGWYTLTRHLKLVPVASDFAISGTTMTKVGAFAAANYSNTSSGHEVGRRIYVVGQGYATIHQRISDNACTLDTNFGILSNQTVYISDYKNSIVQDWVGKDMIFNLTNIPMAWDYDLPGWGQFRMIPQQTNREANVDFTAGTAFYKEIIVSTQPIALPTRFEAAALALPVGAFVLYDKKGIATDGFTDTFTKGSQSGTPPIDGSGGIWSFQSKIHYDSPSRRFIGFGASHGENHDGPGTSKDPTHQADCSIYDIDADHWSLGAPTPGFFRGNGDVASGHTYDCNAIDSVRRKGYVAFQLLGDVYRYDLDTLVNAAITQPVMSHGFGGTGEGSLAYFPDRDRVMFLRGLNLCEYNDDANTWANVTNETYINQDTIGSRAPIMLYSEKAQSVIMFGGAWEVTVPDPISIRRKVIKYNAAGTYSFLPDLPSAITIYTQMAVQWVDPITGNLLIIASDQGSGFNDWNGLITFWELDLTPGAEQWNQLDDTVVPDVTLWWELLINNVGVGPSGVISASSAEYGVTLLGSCEVSGNNEAIYLYRHGEGANLLPDVPPPPVTVRYSMA